LENILVPLEWNSFFPEQQMKEFDRYYTTVCQTTLKEQQISYGTVLRKRFWSQLTNTATDPCFLPAIGNAATELVKKLNSIRENETQKRKVLGIAETSGAGKTKLYFSLGMVDEPDSFSVIFIRLYDANIDTLPFQHLSQEIKSEYAKAGPNQSNEDKIKHAKVGYDKLRLYVTAHVVWLLAISKQLKVQRGFKQRLAWLYALRNGLGNKAVNKVFTDLLNEYAAQSDGHIFADTIMNSTLDSISRQFGPLLFAFDEISYAKDIAPGLFYHYNLYEQKHEEMHSIRDSEIITPKTNTQAADLFYMFRVHMRRLISDFPSVFVAMSDTQFSMHDIVEHGSKSPLNDLVEPWAHFHDFTLVDFCSFFHDFFGLDDLELKELKPHLNRFCGRPHFFYTTVRANLFELCSRNKPKDQTELLRYLKEEKFFEKNFEECTRNFSKNVIKRNWKNQKSYDVDSRQTIANDMRMIHTALVMGSVNTVVHSDAHLKELISTGLLFSPDLSQKALATPFTPVTISLSHEPIVETALRKFGDVAVFKRDHVLECLGSPIFRTTTTGAVLTAIKGELTEQMLAWIIIKNTLDILRTNKTALLKDVLKPLLPDGYVWPAAFNNATVAESGKSP